MAQIKDPRDQVIFLLGESIDLLTKAVLDAISEQGLNKLIDLDVDEPLLFPKEMPEYFGPSILGIRRVKQAMVAMNLLQNA